VAGSGDVENDAATDNKTMNRFMQVTPPRASCSARVFLNEFDIVPQRELC